jgi:hypothetical protein
LFSQERFHDIHRKIKPLLIYKDSNTIVKSALEFILFLK